MWREALTITGEYLERHWSVVAVDHEALVGVCILEAHHDDRADIGHLWVSPEHQRRGVGRTLIHRALQTAQENGYTQVRVESDPFAEPFYVRFAGRWFPRRNPVANYGLRKTGAAQDSRRRDTPRIG